MVDVENKTILAIETYGGEKVVHFYGYGYFCEEDTENPCRFLEYTYFYAPLADVIKSGFAEYEEGHCDSAKTYITDCTYEDMQRFYGTYDNGKSPILIHEDDINIHTPDGVYMVVYN